jgi:tetratricopeptide (TPR) repeat protein
MRIIFSLPVLMLLLCLNCTSAIGAENDGQADLDQATELKLNAKSLADYEKVIKLCESALEKGLNEDLAAYAKQLMVGALWQRAEQLHASMREPGLRGRLPAIREMAVKDLDKLLTLDDKAVDAHLLRARLQAYPGGNRSEAVKSIDKAIELLAEDNKKRSDALILRAGLQQDQERCLADLTAALEADPTNVTAWQARAEYFAGQNQLDKSADDFEKLLERDPKNLAVREALCKALLALKKLDLALEQANKSIEIAPESAAVHVLRAQVYEETSDQNKEEQKLAESDAHQKKALADLDRAVELSAKDSATLAASLFMRARLYFLQDNLTAARADVDRLLLRVRPDMIGGILLRSMISAAQGRFQDAIADVQKLLAQDRDNLELQLQLSSLYVADKRPRKAIGLLSELIQKDKENWMALRARADALLSVGKHAEAIQDYNVAVRLKSDDDGILNNFAWVLATSPDEKLRDGRRAVELATKACEVTQYKKPHILSTLAAAHAETGDFETAIKWSTEAVKLGRDELPDQLEQLEKELESYKRHEPMRELQNIEEKPDPPRNIIET